MLAAGGAPRHRPDGPTRASANDASAGVEVDHQPDATAGHPDADADLPERRVHEVPVVAAVVRPLALEEQVRAEHGGERVAAERQPRFSAQR